MPQVEGLPIKDHYGIVLSKNCVTMLENNFTTNCPTYEELMLAFPDGTDSRISGEFVYKNGLLQREIPTMNNHYKFYEHDKEPTLWIDPPGDVLLRAKIITIENNFKEYILPRGESSFTETLTNETEIVIPIVGPGYKDTKIVTVPGESKTFYYLGNERYVSRTCNKVVIDASNWVNLLGDSMQYLNHKCDPKYTNHLDKKEVQIEMVQHDVSSSYSWQFNAYVKLIKKNCLGSFLGCKDSFDFKNIHPSTILNRSANGY